jgi:hypothetical protein
MDDEKQDICGLCGQPGADKIPHHVHWPGEQLPNTQYVHALCEEVECRRAHAALTWKEIQTFLNSID